MANATYLELQPIPGGDTGSFLTSTSFVLMVFLIATIALVGGVYLWWSLRLERRKFLEENPYLMTQSRTTRRVRAGVPVPDDIEPMDFGKDVDQGFAVTQPMDPGKMYVMSAATVWPADPTIGLVAKAGERFGDATTKHTHN